MLPGWPRLAEPASKGFVKNTTARNDEDNKPYNNEGKERKDMNKDEETAGQPEQELKW